MKKKEKNGRENQIKKRKIISEEKKIIKPANFLDHPSETEMDIHQSVKKKRKRSEKSPKKKQNF